MTLVKSSYKAGSYPSGDPGPDPAGQHGAGVPSVWEAVGQHRALEIQLPSSEASAFEMLKVPQVKWKTTESMTRAILMVQAAEE